MTTRIVSDETIAGVVDAYRRMRSALLDCSVPGTVELPDERTVVSLTQFALDREFKTQGAAAMEELKKLYGGANKGDDWKGE